MTSTRFYETASITPAKVDELICSGNRQSFQLLVSELMREQFGTFAQRVETLYELRDVDDPEFFARDFLLAAHHLILAIRQFPRSEDG